MSDDPAPSWAIRFHTRLDDIERENRVNFESLRQLQSATHTDVKVLGAQYVALQYRVERREEEAKELRAIVESRHDAHAERLTSLEETRSRARGWLAGATAAGVAGGASLAEAIRAFIAG